MKLLTTLRKQIQKSRLKNRRGESIAEVLIALVIVTLAFLQLSGAVVSSAKVNAKLKSSEVAYQTGAAAAAPIDVQIILSDGSKLSPPGAVDGYAVKTTDPKFSYYYYEYSRP